MIFCSGQIPLDPETGVMVAGDVAAQTRQVLGEPRRSARRGGRELRGRGEDDDLPRRHGRLRHGQRDLRRAVRERSAGARDRAGRASCRATRASRSTRSPSSDPPRRHPCRSSIESRPQRAPQLPAARRVRGATRASRAWPSTRRCTSAPASDPEAFWAEVAERARVGEPWTQVLDWKLPDAKWFVGGAAQRRASTASTATRDSWRKNKAAILWEGEPGDTRVLTYGQLHREVCKAANALNALGVKRRRLRRDLHADDPRGGDRDARVRAHRRPAHGRVRRLLGRGARRSHQGREGQAS